MKIAIRQRGNSKGVLIPKPLLAQVGLKKEATITVEKGAIVLRKPAQNARSGWAVAAARIAAAEDDQLVLGEFPNQDDATLKW
ncbi:MAG: AbrB/MazE/SpoVT family DNA-binding domain-containing protein [Steroidobacteraceae bacterium]